MFGKTLFVKNFSFAQYNPNGRLNWLGEGDFSTKILEVKTFLLLNLV